MTNPVAAVAAHPVAAVAAKTPFIDWDSLGKVAVVSFVFAVALVTLYSIGLVGLSWARAEPAPAGAADAPVSGDLRRPIGAAVAAACFLVCAGGVLYGLYLIIPQFHK